MADDNKDVWEEFRTAHITALLMDAERQAEEAGESAEHAQRQIKELSDRVREYEARERELNGSHIGCLGLPLFFSLGYLILSWFSGSTFTDGGGSVFLVLLAGGVLVHLLVNYALSQGWYGKIDGFLDYLNEEIFPIGCSLLVVLAILLFVGSIIWFFVWPMVADLLR